MLNLVSLTCTHTHTHTYIYYSHALFIQSCLVYVHTLVAMVFGWLNTLYTTLYMARIMTITTEHIYS